MTAYLGNFEELGNLVEAHEKAFVHVERLAALLFVHVEVFLQQIYNTVVVAGEQTDEIAEQQNKRAVDYAVVQLGGGHLQHTFNMI